MSLMRLALRVWAREMARQKAQDGKCASLASSFGAAMRQQQNANLISHIYELSGNGTLPVSGGKIELKRRDKLFRDS